ncbi:hypothetical protein BHE74_00046979 [Ensete ventricosum]|nr:hypothetical protein BHE74_00046979 [Ensete ventricosum]
MVINFAKSRVSIDFSCIVSEIQNTSHSNRISPWEVIRAWFREKIRWSKTLHEVEFRSVFRAHSRKSYEHGFGKNATVINIAQSHMRSQVSIGFSCTILEIQSTGHSQCSSPWEVVRARFHKKGEGHKHCAKSRSKSTFDRFFVHRLEN